MEAVEFGYAGCAGELFFLPASSCLVIVAHTSGRACPMGMCSPAILIFLIFQEPPMTTSALPKPPRSSRRAIAAAAAGRASSRRRHIDPTTCERDYQPEELEFRQAVELYKRRNSRPFPTCSELLEVVRSLGYVRVGNA